jgi:transposase-like protein
VRVDHATVFRWVQRDAEAAGRFFRQVLHVSHVLTPRLITVDKNTAYPPAIEALQQEGILPETCLLSSTLSISVGRKILGVQPFDR